MIRLAQLSIRRPKAALALWAAFAAIFVAIGLGITDRLSPTMTFVPGTESTRAEDLATAEFGPSTLVPILLTGPQRQLDAPGSGAGQGAHEPQRRPRAVRLGRRRGWQLRCAPRRPRR